MKKISAVSLVELLVVLAIMGILASLAIPAYKQSMTEDRRQDAILILRDLQVKVEQHLSDYDTLPSVLSDLDGIDSNTPSSSNGYYTISYTPGVGENYTITATAVSGKVQDQDTDCLSIWVSNLYEESQPKDCR